MRHAGDQVREFYDENSTEEWRFLLEPIGFHYHFGRPGGPTGQIFRDAVIMNTFEFIPENARILDCGCGWGGPARLFAEKKSATVTAVTVSQNQYDFIKANLENVTPVLADLNEFQPVGRYDVAVFYESFCHIEDQAGALERVGSVTDQLVIVDFFSRGQPQYNPLMQMTIPPLDALTAVIERAGFSIQYLEDLGADYLEPSARYWKSRLDLMPNVQGHLKVLDDLSAALLASGVPDAAPPNRSRWGTLEQTARAGGMVRIHATRAPRPSSEAAAGV